MNKHALLLSSILLFSCTVWAEPEPFSQEFYIKNVGSDSHLLVAGTFDCGGRMHISPGETLFCTFEDDGDDEASLMALALQPQGSDFIRLGMMMIASSEALLPEQGSSKLATFVGKRAFTFCHAPSPNQNCLLSKGKNADGRAQFNLGFGSMLSVRDH